MKYVGLLRGINVGGNRKVPMPELRALFESLGFTNVSTYVNSGNVIFESETVPEAAFIETQLEEKFGFPIDILILSSEIIQAIAEAIPDTWQNNTTTEKSDVVFLFDDVNEAAFIERIGYRPEFETLQYVNYALLSHLDRKYQTKSCLLRLVGTPLYKQVTIRNVNTARKLAELAQ
ncbi:MAG TPA: DUF1697 domain-containing protein [Dongiaceae bacterium]|nr:DUF1697 domain-containing protein [Dongiaceae bacterium]